MQTQQFDDSPIARASAGPPKRSEFVIRDAYLMTMDPAFSDIPGGSVHVKDGAIVAVGKGIDAPSATVIDGRDSIVLPGLVDTHWHMWTAFLRCMAGDRPEDCYFPMTARYGQAMEPIDMYHSTRLAAAEAISAGITTVGDNCHNIRSRDHAVADLRAIQEIGLRCRWSYGPYRGMPAGTRIDLAELERFHRDWKQYSNEGLVTLGFMWAGVPMDGTPADAMATARREFETARRLSIPMCVHWASQQNMPPGQLRPLVEGNFLGKDVLLIHMLGTTPEEMKIVAAAGSPISVSPISEMRIGYGSTKACEFLEAGILVCVSVDTTPLTGNANLFSALKLLRSAENAKACSEFKLSARRALEMVTIDAARALGLDDRIGSLTLGKRADLILVTTDRLNLGVFTDPGRMLVDAAEQADVDTVVVDGRILKREGKFTALAPAEVIAGAKASLEAVAKRIV